MRGNTGQKTLFGDLFHVVLTHRLKMQKTVESNP